MRIVNPLYDQAFKYLMDNETIAKKILSLILEQEIVSLQSKPQEIKLLNKTNMVPLSRFDFKAIIRTPENTHKNILIEVQKSRNPDPIIRFRRYLGKNYIKEETYINPKGKEVKGPLPIVTIYFLGYSLPEYDNLAIIVNNRVMDAITKKEIKKKNSFVELLTHPSYILQVMKLPTKRRTKLERFLSFFDQDKKTEDDYVLDVEEENNNDLKDIADYLHRGTLDEDLINSLSYEEDYDGSIKKLEEEKEDAKQREKEAKQREKEERRLKEEAKQREEEAKQREEEERRLKEEAKQREEEAKQREKEERRLKEEERRLKEETQNKLAQAIKKMFAKGFSITEIAEYFDISEQQVMLMIP